MSLETNQNQNFHKKPEKRKQSNSKNSYNGYTEFSLREAHFFGTLHEHCLSSEKTQRTEGSWILFCRIIIFHFNLWVNFSKEGNSLKFQEQFLLWFEKMFLYFANHTVSPSLNMVGTEF